MTWRKLPQTAASKLLKTCRLGCKSVTICVHCRNDGAGKKALENHCLRCLVATVKSDVTSTSELSWSISSGTMSLPSDPENNSSNKCSLYFLISCTFVHARTMVWGKTLDYHWVILAVATVEMNGLAGVRIRLSIEWHGDDTQRPLERIIIHLYRRSIWVIGQSTL